MMKVSKRVLLSLSLILFSATAYAENRAIVFATTCPYYEQTKDDVGNFGMEAVPEMDALKGAGWNVVPLYGGNSVWCDAGSDPKCVPSKNGRFEQVLKGSSFQKSDFKPASAANLYAALNDALNGNPARGIQPLKKGDQLLLSVTTHGDMYGFCASDGAVNYDESLITTKTGLIPDPTKGDLKQLFKQLRAKGIDVAYDANHCFSGGAVQKLSEDACVVSVSSATTTGLEGSPTVGTLLRASSGPANMEDLFVMRLASANSVSSFRQPEISGFTPGNQFNDQISDAIFPGNKYDLANETVFLAYLHQPLPSGSQSCASCTDSNASKFYQTYQQMLSSWEDTAGELQSRDFLKELSQSLPPGMDPNSLMSGGFYGDLKKDLDAYASLRNQFHDLAQQEKEGMELLQQTQFPPYAPDLSGIGLPGTQDALRAALDMTIHSEGRRLYVALPDANGKINDPGAFQRSFLNPQSLQEISTLVSQYYTSAMNSRLQPNARQQFQEDIQKQVMNRLNQAPDQMFNSVAPDRRAKLSDFLHNYSQIIDGEGKLGNQINSDSKVLQARLSARIALALDASYVKYKATVEAKAPLTPLENAALDKMEHDDLMEWAANKKKRLALEAQGDPAALKRKDEETELIEKRDRARLNFCLQFNLTPNAGAAK